MSHLPSLTALRCFDASARHASFTKAAAEVHLTQGGVSHQVIALEAMLGAPLFVRRRAGLQLTVAGQAYWREISPALRQIERATQDIATHKGLGGALNLTVDYFRKNTTNLLYNMPIPGTSGFTSVTSNIANRAGTMRRTRRS